MFMAIEDPFSAKELKYLKDTDFLLTKVSVQDKLNQLMSNAEAGLRDHFNQSNYQFPEGTFSKSGKISKGENYHYLPYFTLDYPRKFTRNGIFAYRTMIWWGHFFSSTLHIEGPDRDIFQNTIIDNVNSLYNNDIFVGVNNTPWEYHYEENNYLPADEFTKEHLINHLKQHPFIKLSRKMDLNDWKYLPEFTLNTFKIFAGIIKLN